MNIQSMMKQAQEMQERLKKQMADMRVEATAGGGMVTVVVNGVKQLQSIRRLSLRTTSRCYRTSSLPRSTMQHGRLTNSWGSR